MKKHGHWIFIAAVVILPLTVFAVVKWYENQFTRLPVLVSQEHRVGDFNLTNQYGKTISLKDWNDKIVVANFFFTHCPVVCPKMMRNLVKVQNVYRNDKNFLITSFSVDPERDTVAQLQNFASRMNVEGAWHLLTGSKKEIYAMARKSFRVTATDGDGGPQDFIHSESLVLVDKQGRIRGYYNGTNDTEVANLIRDINRLQKEN
ncbi:SCO family protein [Flavisolibacter ginsenosidimutans]|uniref:SCO family protein n=1 Tax=Flavisolibacter ginsenosidimutans TaxID=661481 RepID=A0A5B8UH59_9BACT|nr:SCO family protein [Flavisolibacter ginsenosidimutans]QEC55449.1 SCO family protein [Flavisolibacter ginsenosidimutans]